MLVKRFRSQIMLRYAGKRIISIQRIVIERKMAESVGGAEIQARPYPAKDGAQYRRLTPNSIPSLLVFAALIVSVSPLAKR